MAHSLVSPNTFALKLDVHCKVCERKLRTMLRKIQGVHSVKVDEKLKYIIISGTVDPPTILTILEKLGRKAELLWEQVPPVNNSKNIQIITQSEVINPLSDPDTMKQLLGQFSGIPGLQTVVVTKTITLTFQPDQSKDDPSDKSVIATKTNVNGSHQQVISHDHNSHGGGFCAASSSCCGGHQAAQSYSQNLHGCCHGNNSCASCCCANNRNRCHNCPPPMESWGWGRPLTSQPPPVTQPSWSSSDSIPSAPPLQSDYNYHASSSSSSAPPSFYSMPNTYYNDLSDENVNSRCIIQ